MFPLSKPRILQECRRYWCIFAFCIVIGAGFGALLAASVNHSYVLLMCTALRRPVSIVGLAVSYAVPCITFLCAIVHCKRWLVYFVCICQIFRFTCVGWALQRYFGSSAWLIRFLMQLPDICLIPVMIFGAIQAFAKVISKRYLLLYTVISVMVGMIYFYLVSPFLAKLIVTYETMGRFAIHVGFDWCL